jgi:glucuronoarabinoxylan endo-1,4-beta-xylanase
MTAGLVVAQKINDLFVNANVNSFTYWKATDATGDLNNCLICGTNKPKFAYAIGNFAKYVRPGWVRLDCNATWCGSSATNNSGVFVSAYKNTSTGAFTIVAINSKSSNMPIALSFSGFTSSTVTPHITDPTHSLADLPAISAGSGLSYTMPPQSVVTFTGTNGS